MVNALLEGNEGALNYVFYDHFRPLLYHNYTRTCKGMYFVEFADMVQQLYLYLSENDWERLRRYNPAMPFVNWFSVVSYRYFKDFFRSMIDSTVQKPIIDIDDHDSTLAITSEVSQTLLGDLWRVLPLLEPPRDRQILKSFLIDDEAPETVAKRHGVTIDNLYNIKRRALTRLVKNYLMDYKR